MKMIKFKTIGSDPEFGARKGRINLPSFMFLEGTKSKPEEIQNGFFLLKDNLLLEGNIPPASSVEEFVENMGFLKLLARTILASKGAVLVEEDILKYSPKFVKTKDGQEFGCSSFEYAYGGYSIQSPSLTGNNRTVGSNAV